jgi:hypothetical protein
MSEEPIRRPDIPYICQGGDCKKLEPVADEQLANQSGTKGERELDCPTDQELDRS